MFHPKLATSINSTTLHTLPFPYTYVSVPLTIATTLSSTTTQKMSFQDVHDQEMSLVLSSDAKPRLKWTPELHRLFVDAVNQLGGHDKATPKSLMRIMGIHGLTLYHLKSHLQKYRLGKSQPPQYHSDNNQEDTEIELSQSNGNSRVETQGHTTESMQIAEALRMQMEVQRELHEQIEVQRHLQLRIEAQEKYLQSVLMKAQETLAGYSSSSLRLELAKADLSQLVSIVETSCPSSSFSVLTEVGGSNMKGTEKNCSLESSLTSSDTSMRKEDIQPKQRFLGDDNSSNQNSASELPLMEMQPEKKGGGSSNQAKGKKRFGIHLFDHHSGSEKQPSFNRSSSQREQGEEKSRKFGLLEGLDLNIQCINDCDSGLQEIDLNLHES